MHFLRFIMGGFWKSLLNVLQYCSHYKFWLLVCKACGTLALCPGMEAEPPALESEVCPNHWTAREVLMHWLLKMFLI